jgi:hypothetical protein
MLSCLRYSRVVGLGVCRGVFGVLEVRKKEPRIRILRVRGARATKHKQPCASLGVRLKNVRHQASTTSFEEVHPPYHHHPCVCSELR